MDRLTIPDKPIEGGIRRAVVDARAVREQAMTLYWALKKYEDTGLTPEQIREIDRLYSEKCRELSVSMENFKALSERMDAEEHGCFCWIPVEELLPEPHTDVIVAVQEFGEETAVLIDCLVEMESGKYGWGTYNGALERVRAWMPLPEPYQAE